MNEEMLRLALGDSENATAILNQIKGEIAKRNQKQVEHSPDNKIMIPESMNKQEAANELIRQYKDEESIVDVARDFDKWMPDDVLVAIRKACEKVFGYINGVAIHSIFGSSYPTEVDVKVDVINGREVTETCFYGKIEVAPWEDGEVYMNPSRITARVKKRYKGKVLEFLNTVEEILKTESIYLGKTVSVTKNENPDDDRELNFEIFEINPNDKIVLNDDIELIIDHFLLPDVLSSNKRTALFSGGYGNGKTETAMRIGKYAADNGLVFFYCKESDTFESVLETAIHYGKAMIFLEDLDEIGSGEARDQRMNSILNTLDGVRTKNKNIKVIFTTNHENQINPALRRPGRLDVVIKFDNPNTESCAEILRRYWEPYMKEELNLISLAEEIPYTTGSVVAEIAKRGIRLAEDNNGTLTYKRAQAAVQSMIHHIALMTEGENEESVVPSFTLTFENGTANVKTNGVSTSPVNK